MLPSADPDRAVRAAMVAEQIRARGVTDPRVLEALERVPRSHFVEPSLAHRAHDDSPLPIGESQTISQPYMVAVMTAALGLQGTERVLEIGTGSGYQTAILAELAASVFTIERHASLAARAADRLAALGYSKVRTRVGDGSVGWPEEAPFDAILVAAGAPRVPASLVAQLGVGGRLVVPVGDRNVQVLVRVTRTGPGPGAGDLRHEELDACRFVDLVGDEGWPE